MPYIQGMNSLSSSLVALAEEYAAVKKVSLWRVGHLSANRGSFFVDLQNQRRHCQTNTYERVIQWFSDHWPADEPWPADIPRPEPTVAEPVEAA